MGFSEMVYVCNEPFSFVLLLMKSLFAVKENNYRPIISFFVGILIYTYESLYVRFTSKKLWLFTSSSISTAYFSNLQFWWLFTVLKIQKQAE
jgi:hypothetical protein